MDEDYLERSFRLNNNAFRLENCKSRSKFAEVIVSLEADRHSFSNKHLRHCSVLQGNVILAILSNYMVDIDWLLSGKFYLH